MSVFIKTGSTVRVHPEESIESSNNLFPGIYKVVVGMSGTYLEFCPKYEITNNLYGEIKRSEKRVIDTFNSRPGNTGVLFSGMKGSGKSLLARMISLSLLKQGISTIIINLDQVNANICEFINTIESPCVIFIDEIDKVEKENHNYLLSLMDGTSSHKKLFILTANEEWDISEWLINRPGRVFYHFRHTGISDETVREYCEKHLKYKKFIEDVLAVKYEMKDFSFDALVSIVEESNRYKESPKAFAKFMNFEKELHNVYSLTVKFKDKVLESSDDTLYGLDMQDKFYLHIKKASTGVKAGTNVQFCEDDIVSFFKGRIIYRNKEGFEAILEPKKNKSRTFLQF